MDEEEGGGIRLSKRFSDKGGEVDYKTKAGTAWSHSYLNQKPWHPLSYPNQRRKWIAEQTHAQRERRAEEVAREYAQEQEFFRQSALISKKEKEKMETMKAVSFMYVRPPGYNAESAKAADMADERKKQEQEQNNTSQGPFEHGASTSMKHESLPSSEEKKKPRPKDVFGRALPTEEQFEVLKNAPRLETGVAGRSKPFGVEIRNVKCLRCGNFGHQSGDRECPLKDAIMPSEENRLKRDDPLTAIQALTDVNEPLKWELKQKPGLSPVRGGFRADDPNQQIVAEDIFDEYGGFLSGDNIPDLLANFSSSEPKKKSSSKRKHKRQLSPTEVSGREKWSSSNDDGGRRLEKKRHKKSSRKHSHSSLADNLDSNMLQKGNRSLAGGERDRHLKKKRSDRKSQKHSVSSLQENSDSDVPYDHRDNGSSSGDDRKRRSKLSPSSGDDHGRRLEKKRHHKSPRKHSRSSLPDKSDFDMPYNNRNDHRSSAGGDRISKLKDRRHEKKSRVHSESSLQENSNSGVPYNHQDDGSSSGDDRKRRSKKIHKRKSPKDSYSSQSEISDYDRHFRSSRYKHSHPTSSENSDSDGHYRNRRHRHGYRH
nr:uncharacterized zinc finger CCHC domain-containing protein At4g19190-like [Coffea arabica]